MKYSYMLAIGVWELIGGTIIAVYGIHMNDALVVAVGAVLLSIGIWTIQSAETKKSLNEATQEIKEEIRKLGNQLEEIKRMKTRSAGIITEKEFQSKKAARIAKETFQARKNRRVRYS